MNEARTATAETLNAPFRVVGYVRVSTAEQADSGAGLAAQRAVIEAESSRRGWQLVQIFEDAGMSGKAMLNRPALSVALEALKHREADALLVAKLDRLSRSLLDFAGLLQRSTKEGWRVLPLDLGIDLTTPAGEFMAAVMAAAAQWERRIISQRTKDALAQKQAAGVRLGAPTSIPQDVAAQIVEMREGGATLQAIADTLNDLSIPTTTGNPWQPSTIQRVIVREGAPRYPRGRRPAVSR
jgi:DNA invertase Pin-like site-specific DNA recombinase